MRGLTLNILEAVARPHLEVEQPKRQRQRLKLTSCLTP